MTILDHNSQNVISMDEQNNFVAPNEKLSFDEEVEKRNNTMIALLEHANDSYREQSHKRIDPDFWFESRLAKAREAFAKTFGTNSSLEELREYLK